MNDLPRVLIADEQPTARAALRSLLEDNGFEVCAEVGNAEVAVEVARRERPDICLMDVSLPGGGILATRELAAKVPNAAVVILTGSRQRNDLLDAIRAGAAGYLLKGMNPDRIPHALRGVMNGEAAIPRTLVPSLVDELRTHGRRRRLLGGKGVSELTAREWEVLDLMCQDLTTEEIARRLFVDAVTVRRHASSVVSKLGVGSREEAVALVEGKS